MDSLYKNSEWMNTSQHDRLLETYFCHSPIHINWDMHDTQRVIDGKLVFGAWAGPLRCITHIIHEMCHLVEIDDARILRNGWGLVLPEVYIPGRYARIASVPLTYQAAKRETRVAALQYQLQNLLGIPTTFRQVVSSFKFLPDWCNIPAGVDRNSDHTLVEVDEGRYQFLEQYLRECMEGKYTLSFFHQEWERKIALLKAAQ